MKKQHKAFSPTLFVTINTLTAIGLFFLLALIAPGVWKVQLEASWGAIILLFLTFHLMNAFVEFFFHRYVLHKPFPGLRRFWKKHTRHHALTMVVVQSDGNKNYYPILEEKQKESSFFPWYTLIIFCLVYTPILTMVQILFPKAPVFICGWGAIVFSLVLYEFLHATEHVSLEKWKRLLDHPKFGWFWKKVYAFHLRHHAEISSNESISGFFGIPIPDIVFRTYVNPGDMFEHGKPGNKPKPPDPVAFIRWLDKVAERRMRKKK